MWKRNEYIFLINMQWYELKVIVWKLNFFHYQNSFLLISMPVATKSMQQYNKKNMPNAIVNTSFPTIQNVKQNIGFIVYFDNMVSQIYPSELKLNKANTDAAF